MLQLTIPTIEMYDDDKEEFVYVKGQTLRLEHSLVSISKWESKWCKPFLTKKRKSEEETLDYIRCMTLTQNVNPELYNHITDEQIGQVNEYIDAPMTATWFSNNNKTGKPSTEQVTSELIYYWMITLNIPVDECQKWHLNRLLTLIKVCNIKNQPPKKMDKKSLLSRNAELNAARRKRLNTRG